MNDDPGGRHVGLPHIELTDKSHFDSIFAALKQPVSDYTFANTFMWGGALKLYWARLHRHTCVFANGTGDLTLLLPPLPEPGATDADLRDAVRDCFEKMDAYNDRYADRSRSRIEYVSDELIERLSAAGGLNLSVSPFSGDYVYDMRKMIELDGKSLKSKRHSRSKFMRDYPDFRTADFCDDHVAAADDLLTLWQRVGDASHTGEVNEDHLGSDVLRERDTHACQNALRYWKELNLTGMSLFVGDKLVGFTLGEQLSPTQASIVIEKTHPDFYGSAQYIFSEFCRQKWADLPECNVGDDWGIPSLRFTKSSYRPTRLINKHIVTLARPVVVGPINRYDIPLANPMHTMTGAIENTAPQVTLRDATPSDAAAIFELEQACFESEDETFTRRQVRYVIGNPRAHVRLAECEGRIVGWCVALVRQHRHWRSGRVYAVAVSPTMQGRGIGKRLITAVMNALRDTGIERMYLEVRHDNAPAIRLYKSLGYVDHRFLPNYYGELRHGIRMRLITPAHHLFEETADRVSVAV
ncbi:MAG: GNAT family N-acetyltransferase [Planctomycetes bacterium]|nr:GNAT family N-acetyltransferase [Planctomycetota bacterium]